MEDKNYLVHNFELLRSDKKLEGVMKEEVTCQLQMWILEIQRDQCISQRLLYAWIIPVEYCDNKWYKADVETKWSPDSSTYKANIFKFTFYSNGDSIASLISALLQGTSLAEACTNLNFTKPPIELEGFTLGLNNIIEDTFVVRPPIFLGTESINAFYKDYFRSIQSPSHYVSCASGSLFCLQKLRLWGGIDLSSKPLDNADELARFCIRALKRETSLAFDDSDSSRLGNLEWISFPLSDPETSPIDFCTIKEDVPNQKNRVFVKEISCKEVNVFLQSGIYFPYSNLLIRCRLRNENEIVLDQIKLVEAKEVERGLRFLANQQVSRVQLTIWIANTENNDWDIWYEQDTPLMREMNMAMGLTGLQGEVKLSTLQELKNSQKVKNRVQHYEKVKQTSYQQSKIGGYIHDPWIPSSREINDYVKRLFPSKSKGEFFQKGWGAEGPSVLSFAEWFQSLTNNTDNKLITIVDPYFDTVGIELIAHSSTTNTSFEVITCTQVKSNNDNVETKVSEIDPQKKNYEPERAIRIKKACDHLRLILSRLQLNIWDLRSNQNGKSSYFHDRYFLIYDSIGNVSEGYHLSNSLQAATKFDPLLVTPIPIDILEEVASYVDALRNAQSPIINNASSILIYPKMEVNNDASLNIVESNNDNDLLKRITKTNVFFAELLQDSELASKDFEYIKRKLLDVGLISSDNFHFVAEEELVDEALYAFSETLVEKEDKLFSILWESFSFWLANVVDSEKYLFKVCDYAGNNLVNRISSYLLNPSGLNIETINEAKELEVLKKIHFMYSNFNESLYDAHLLLDGHYANRLLGQYHLRYATKAIIYLQPSQTVNILEALYVNKEQQKRQNIVVAAYLLDELIIHLLFYSDHDLILPLLLSNVPSLRALGSQAKWFHIKDITKDPTLSVYDLTELDKTERIFAYSEWIYHLRVNANRKGNESLEIKNVRISLYELIRVNWNDNLSKCEKKAILHRLCGPSAGSWATDIYLDLMLYLVQDKKISNDKAILFWVNLLLEKIEGSKNKNVSFNAPTDSSLTELCASILPNLSEESWNSIVKQIRKQINKCNREIRRSFEKSINFRNWNNTKKQGLWIKTFLELVYEASNDEKSDILDLLNLMDNKLKDATDCTDNYLIDFSNGALQSNFGNS